MELSQLSQTLAEELSESFAAYDGRDVRIDAGDEGMVYVAVRGARGDIELGERLADELNTHVERVVSEAGDAFDFALSLGAGDDDLLLQIDIREV